MVPRKRDEPSNDTQDPPSSFLVSNYSPCRDLYWSSYRQDGRGSADLLVAASRATREAHKNDSFAPRAQIVSRSLIVECKQASKQARPLEKPVDRSTGRPRKAAAPRTGRGEGEEGGEGEGEAAGGVGAVGGKERRWTMRNSCACRATRSRDLS